MSHTLDGDDEHCIFYRIDDPIISDPDTKCVVAADELAIAIRPWITCELVNLRVTRGAGS